MSARECEPESVKPTPRQQHTDNDDSRPTAQVVVSYATPDQSLRTSPIAQRLDKSRKPLLVAQAPASNARSSQSREPWPVSQRPGQYRKRKPWPFAQRPDKSHKPLLLAQAPLSNASSSQSRKPWPVTQCPEQYRERKPWPVTQRLAQSRKPTRLIPTRQRSRSRSPAKSREKAPPNNTDTATTITPTATTPLTSVDTRSKLDRQYAANAHTPAHREMPMYGASVLLSARHRTGIAQTRPLQQDTRATGTQISTREQRARERRNRDQHA